MGETATTLAMFTHPFHVFDNHNAFLSEGGALTVVVRDFPKRRMGRGITRISHVPCEKAKRGGASRVPAGRQSSR